MSRGSNERHVSQRYRYETLLIPYAMPTPPVQPLLEPYNAAWPYPLTDTSSSSPSIPSLTAFPSCLAPFTVHSFSGPYRKYTSANVNVKSIGAVISTRATRAAPWIPLSTNDQVQRDIALANVNNDICRTSPSNCGNENKGKVDNVKGKRAPQINSESSAISSNAETTSTGSTSLSQSSPSNAPVTGSQTSPTSSSILTSLPSSVPENSVTSTPPPTFTSAPTTTVQFTTSFTLTSSAPTSPTTSANGITSSTPNSTPLPTTGRTTISSSPDSRTLSTPTSSPFPATTTASSPSSSIPTTPTSTSSPSTTTTTTTISSSPSDSSTLSRSTTTSQTISSSTMSLSFPTSSSYKTSISGRSTSLALTTPPSSSTPSSTSVPVIVTNITISSSTITSSFTINTLTSSSSSFSPPLYTSFTDPGPPPPPSTSLTQQITSGVLSTITSTRVFMTTLSNGSTTVVTTVIQTGVLSTNISPSGSRFSRNTGAVIAVAVCATAGVIIFVFVLFLLCKRYRERKERQNRRRRRPGLRLPAVTFSGPSDRQRTDSRANILGAGYSGDWSRSRSGEAVIESGEARRSEDEEDEEGVWRSPLVGEDDDDVVIGTRGVRTPPKNGEARPPSGGKSSTGHQSGQSHSLAHSRNSSWQQGPGKGVPPSMAEFGVGPVSYAAYAYPPALVGYPAYLSDLATGSGGVGSGALGVEEGQARGPNSHGFHGSPASFVPGGPNAQFVPYPAPTTVPGVRTGGHEPPATNGEEIQDKLGQGQHTSRRASDEEVAIAAGGHATSTTAATAADTSGLVSRGTSGSKSSIRSTGSKNLRGFMDRIRTSVPNIQVTDVMLPTRRSSRDNSSPPSTSSGETRPGYDYGAVGRPRNGSNGVQLPPPVAFVYPGFHAIPPGAPGVDVPNDLPRNPHVGMSNHLHGPIPFGYSSVPPDTVLNWKGERGLDEDEDDSVRIKSGVVTSGLLDPILSRRAGEGGDGGSIGGRSSPNVEGASLRDHVDYSRRIGGMIKNHVTRSTTTFETIDQDGSIHRVASGGTSSTPG